MRPHADNALHRASPSSMLRNTEEICGIMSGWS
jgi:hypothetical protein